MPTSCRSYEESMVHQQVKSAIVNYGAGPSSLRDRIQGCNEVFDSYPGIKLVATKVGDFTTTRQLNDE